MTTHPYVLADVFTDLPLSGNQLAVFTAAEQIDESYLQPIAKEMNLAETVFAFPPSDGGDLRMRIFTAAEEVPFAGHPTLGTACIIAESKNQDVTTVVLETRRGKVPVDVRRESSHMSGWMVQPLPAISTWDRVEDLLAILKVSSPIVPIEVYDAGLPHLYVVLEDPAEVAAIVPDFAAMRSLGSGPRFNVLAGSGSKYLTRMFTPFDPAMPEDPATGSAAGPLSAHLVRHGLVASGEEITISQGEFVGRPSTLLAATEIDTDGTLISVRVGGSSVIVGRGELYL